MELNALVDFGPEFNERPKLLFFMLAARHLIIFLL